MHSVTNASNEAAKKQHFLDAMMTGMVRVFDLGDCTTHIWAWIWWGFGAG